MIKMKSFKKNAVLIPLLLPVLLISGCGLDPHEITDQVIRTSDGRCFYIPRDGSFMGNAYIIDELPLSLKYFLPEGYCANE